MKIKSKMKGTIVLDVNIKIYTYMYTHQFSISTF